MYSLAAQDDSRLFENAMFSRVILDVSNAIFISNKHNIEGSKASSSAAIQVLFPNVSVDLN